MQQLGDPALVVADVTQRLQVLQQTADHAGHGGHGFQYHRAVAVAPGEEPVGDEPQRFDEAERDPVAHVGGFVVGRCGGVIGGGALRSHGDLSV